MLHLQNKQRHRISAIIQMKKAFRSTDDIVFGVSVGPNRMQAAQKSLHIRMNIWKDVFSRYASAQTLKDILHG